MNTEPNLEVGLVAFLEGNAALTKLIGRRIYPLVLPQGVIYPAVSYYCVDDDTDQSQDATTQESGAPRFTIDVWAATYQEAKRIHRIIKAWLLGHVHGWWTEGCWVAGVTFITAIDFFDEDAEVYHIASDYYIDWCEEN